MTVFARFAAVGLGWRLREVVLVPLGAGWEVGGCGRSEGRKEGRGWLIGYWAAFMLLCTRFMGL